MHIENIYKTIAPNLNKDRVQQSIIQKKGRKKKSTLKYATCMLMHEESRKY